MPPIVVAKKQIVVVVLSALLVAFAMLVLSPVLTKNSLFLAALPFAAILFLVMVLNIKTMFVFIIFTRSFLDPILSKTKIGEGGGIGSLLNIFVIVMTIFLILKNPKKLRGNHYVTAWVVFLCCAALTILYSPSKSQGIKLLLNLSTYAAIFSVPFFIVKNGSDKKFWVKWMLLSSFIPIGFANLGIVGKHPLLYSFDRLQGTFTHANILAFYVVLVIVLVLFVLRTRIMNINVAVRLGLWLYLLDLLVLLIVTQTRSAWLSCAALFLIYGIMKERKFLLVCLIAGAILFMVPAVQTRLKDLGEGTGVRRSEQLNSMVWRMKLWESAVPSIKKRIVLGHGLGSFQFLSSDFFELEKKTGAPAHNVYVELLFETGLVGLLTFLAIYVLLLRTLYHRFWRAAEDFSRESALMFSYLIGYMMVCVSDNALYYLAFNWYLWFLAGVIIQGGNFYQTPVLPNHSDETQATA